MANGRWWDESEDQKLLDMREAGYTLVEIAARLSRPYASVQKRWNRLEHGQVSRVVRNRAEPETVGAGRFDSDERQANAEACDRLLVLLRRHHEMPEPVPDSEAGRPLLVTMRGHPEIPSQSALADF